MPRPSTLRNTHEVRRRCRLVARIVALVAALGGSLAACGHGASRSASTPAAPSPILHVYSSLPLQGAASPQAQAILDGAKLALLQAGGRAGTWTVTFTSLDDSAGAAAGWDPGRTAANARQAAADPNAVLYIGEGGSDATAVSLPILNQAGLGQIAPAGGYVGLTGAGAGAAAGDPARYYPSGLRTYFQLDPGDRGQVHADLAAMRAGGCQEATVVAGSGLVGTEFEQLLDRGGRAGTGAVAFTLPATLPSSPAAVAALVDTLAHGPAGCVFVAAPPSPVTVQLVQQLRQLVPALQVFGVSSLCASPFADQGVAPPPGSHDWLLECALPASAAPGSPAMRAFASRYRARYGPAPPPSAAFGYEAMELALAAIARVRTVAGARAAVRAALARVRVRHSVLGSFRFGRDGQSTLRSFALYRVGADGALGLYRPGVP